MSANLIELNLHQDDKDGLVLLSELKLARISALKFLRRKLENGVSDDDSLFSAAFQILQFNPSVYHVQDASEDSEVEN